MDDSIEDLKFNIDMNNQPAQS